MLRTHNCWEIDELLVWQKVTLCWWVNSARDHWGVVFVDLRDRFWITQIKADPATAEAKLLEKFHSLKDEYVLKISWIVEKRPEWTENTNIKTWKIEIIPEEVKILSKSDVLPFQVSDNKFVWEETRMKYRYLDLRRENMKNNIISRHNMTNKIFKYLVDNWFLYIETPSLIKNTPEWAREYIVPSRNFSWKAYVLPQSPQQLKQILMVSWFDRYFQIARCFRDEDLRWDRQPEFTQIDMELSFVEQKDIIEIINWLFLELTNDLFKDKKISSENFPIYSWEEAMNNYWIDKPELRTKELNIIDVSDIAKKSELKVFWDVVKSWWVVKAMVSNNIFTRSQIDKYTSLLAEKWAKWLAYIIWDEEWPKSPILKFFPEELQKELFSSLWLEKWKTAFFQATNWLEAVSYLWYLRTMLIKDLNIVDWLENELNFSWVVDFPMFEIDEETWKLNSMHHPFTKPKEEYIDFVKSVWNKLKKWEQLNESDVKELLNVKADAYDLVLNWYEVAWWSVRIYDQELQEAIFYILWLNETEIQERFSHMLEAFKYWVPPHAGIAIWFDRAVMVYQNTPNIREVIPFPKTQKWEDLMLNSPSEIDPKLLQELWLQIKKKINK